MNYNFILSLAFSFVIFPAALKFDNTARSFVSTTTIHTTGYEHSMNSHRQIPSALIFLSLLTDDGGTGHHNHHDHQGHCLYFERLRRKPQGFSIRCACAKLLLVVLHTSLLVLMIFQFLHEIYPA